MTWLCPECDGEAHHYVDEKKRFMFLRTFIKAMRGKLEVTCEDCGYSEKVFDSSFED